MNISLRKLIRSQKKLLLVSIAIISGLIVIQFSYVGYVVNSGTDVAAERIVVPLKKSKQSKDNLLLNDIERTDFKKALHNLYRSFTIYSKQPVCTKHELSKLINKYEVLVQSCESIQVSNNVWVNTLYKSQYALTYPINITFGLIALVFFILLIIFFIQLAWRIPYLEFQQFAFEMGMYFQSKSLKKHKGKLLSSTVATFDFMQNRVNHIIEYQNKLLAMTCHDIRTPLARIQARRLTDLENSLNNKDLNDIEEINQMLDDLVLFSKENWLAGISPEKVSISEFIDDIVNEYIELDKDIRLINQLYDDLYLEIKKPALKRAISNIINNGFKHGNQVKIYINDIDNNAYKLIIQIQDNGPGIPDDEITKVFEPFYTGSSAKKGNGLGLTVCKEIIEAHQGELYLKNNVEGGLNVTIKL
ncbi:hypothetical protein LO80_01705 [Candidatus Francisella endociliophora]|uniref:histidine kinase n=1 Tax=Candidatus Francisella endociliophora TaxID=653937 RepID=A0A097EMM0_9GAMM|nr:HAMP domain-containing sensor histidine kinase [Francisella sp. FSC1006]AIT08816.1 hypothetical protein LO80_01705 [Francisella sp. FSC1006]